MTIISDLDRQLEPVTLRTHDGALHRALFVVQQYEGNQQRYR